MSKALRKLSALQKCCCMLLARRHQCTTENGYFHIPVMLQEVIQSLGIQQDQTFVDLTFGAGGHTKHILAAAKGVRVFALDRDPIAYRRAQEMAKQYPAGRLVPLLGRFSELGPLLERHGVSPGSLDGALVDCGCSSMQMDDPQRGFGLARQGPLDMRMDAARFPDEPTAADVVNSLDYDSLVQVLKLYGEEKRAKKVAQAIVDSRFLMKSLRTTTELARIVEVALDDTVRSVDSLGRPSHPATKTFMALRILVNNELNELHWALGLLRRWLRQPGGRLAVLTFHSLEDRIVKRHFQGVDVSEPVDIAQRYRNAAVWHSAEEMVSERQCYWQPLGPLQLPSRTELERNPRSRSAKLRVAERTAVD
ncbi:12S rRNA N(4)-cytidine methyltransferase METTL15 isoform X1 [Dermacentor andersoni]|uniref:12S rRNA N(4)-cytidine methyltransferase METTL15 isoform X1 n=1 Tax=Dermacentor andersoni TaxID=34620 RepID=UPI002155F511|nr:12S rRNA N4-methylcytidine (m4C) methyltransferase-like isoform X1 [Dermacentor andersoni]